MGKKTLRTTCEFFKRLSEAKLTINLSKSEFGRAQVTSLEHVVGQSQVKPVSVKVEAITTFPQAENKKEVMRLVGMAGHCRRLCSNFATVAKLLTQLLSKKVQFIWNELCENAFEESYVTELTAPDFSSSFKFAVDVVSFWKVPEHFVNTYI